MYRFRIESFTTAGGDTSLEDMVVIIGPNNAGKSQLLKDLLASTTERNSERTIIKSIEVAVPKDLKEFESTYHLDEFPDGAGVTIRCLGPTLVKLWKSTHRDSKWRDEFEEEIQEKAPKKKEYFTFFLGSRVVGYSPTDGRLALSSTSSGLPDGLEIRDLYAALYAAGSDAEETFRQEFESTFRMKVRFDFSTPGRFRLRIGENADNAPEDPRDALRHYTKLGVPVLDQQGDGIRAYTGLLLAFMVSDKPVLLIDEPELFLHPLLSRRMGEYIGHHVGEEHRRQCVATTHDAQMLTGIVASNQHSQVIRVQRHGNTNTLTKVDGRRISELAEDPVLGKERVLEGLFHQFVVLTEGDADAKFFRQYLSRFYRELDIHVIDTNGKRSIPKCSQFFTDAGVPTLAVLDFDVFNDAETLNRVLVATGAPDGDRELVLNFQKALEDEVNAASPEQRIQKLRSLVEDLYGRLSKEKLKGVNPQDVLRESRELADEVRRTSSAWEAVKEKGLAALNDKLQDQFNECELALRRSGLLIWRTGQLESILQEHGVSEPSKKVWLQKALRFLDRVSHEDVKNDFPFLKIDDAIKYLVRDGFGPTE